MNDILIKTPASPMEKAKRLMELQNIVRKLKPEIDILKAELLKVTQELDVYTLKTGTYTISRAKRITPEVTDFKKLKAALEKNKIPYDTKVVFAEWMNETFKKIVTDGRVLPGLEATETEYISVRIRDPKVKSEII